MKRRSLISIVLVVLATLAACEKDKGPKGSGDLSASDKELFKYLPPNATALFGGNYMKLQHFMTSQLGKMTAAAMEKLGPGMTEWMSCFTELKNLALGGSAEVKGKGVELRMVFTGAKLDDIKKCADRASFTSTVDPDGKFIGIELPAPAGLQGYLVLPGGALYTRQSMIISAVPVVTPAARSELEADIAAVAKSNAIGDTKLQALVAKVDRSKTVWFAGTGANTPISDKLGEVYGSFDIASGLAADVTIQITDHDLVSKLEDGVKEMKKMSDQLPGEFKSVIEGLQFSRSGDHVRFAIVISESQFAGIMKQANMFGGMR